jgi:hypothetical protein
MEDRSLAFREMRERNVIKSALQDLGIEIQPQHALFIQRCIELAKENPQLQITQIVKDVCREFRQK